MTVGLFGNYGLQGVVWVRIQTWHMMHKTKVAFDAVSGACIFEVIFGAEIG